MSLVQIVNRSSRRVALVSEPDLICLESVESIYELASACIVEGTSLSERARELAKGERLSYGAVYAGLGEWSLWSPIDVPGKPEYVFVGGTGLTHLGSAKDRQAMHQQEAAETTPPMNDSMRMFQSGVAGGRPKTGEIGTAPEWFYKGNGSVVRPPFSALRVPSYADDGGEEAEIAGIYLIGADGQPHRIGMCAGNEFADHKLERSNYLNLAGSKLRDCSLGPELIIGADFHSVTGEVSVERNGIQIWHKDVETGEANMSHSLANLEHHHFKFEAHRIPGHVHVHFFGAQSLSFGDGLTLENGDLMRVHYEGYGRPLYNSVRIEDKLLNRPVLVHPLS